ncbi:MAG: T9SS type A sorting domain-containing protein [Saprospiraceae bacterium]|nr:T9SS type A sorting domain-containing protein [Saprospiraceae bacterium]
MSETGELVGCGTYRLEGEIHGYLFKLGRDGELLWESLYTYYDDFAELSQGYFSNLELGRDGNVIAVGGLLKSDEVTSDIWLLNVDENGCLDQLNDCEFIQIINNSSVNTESVKPNKPFIVYPNPFKDIISIDFLDYYPKEPTFELIDLSGQRLVHAPLNTQETEIDLIQLPAGMYLYNIVDQGVVLKTGKLVKVE